MHTHTPITAFIDPLQRTLNKPSQYLENCLSKKINQGLPDFSVWTLPQSNPEVCKKKVLNTEASPLINEEGTIELDYSSLPSLMK